MPRKATDYKKAVIYKICNNDETLLYIGSTTDFRHRKNDHKTNCHNDTRKKYLFYVYQMIRDNCGWEAFEMKPVKEFPCENKTQLVIEEERIRKELNANLNNNRAYRDIEQEKEYNRESAKKHYEQNKEAYSIKNKEYRNKQKLIVN